VAQFPTVVKSNYRRFGTRRGRRPQSATFRRVGAAKLGDDDSLRGGKSMKKLMIAALVAAQMAAGQAAAAAEIVAAETRPGAFAGLRLRAALDGPDQGEVRAGLTVAPDLQSRAGDGATRTRIGEGVELGIASDRPLAVTLAGTRIDRLGAPDGRRANLSTWTWVAIGVGTLVTLAILSAVAFDEISDQSE
jgi:hypothetical protein